ncbi:MAG: ABC transporter ATP-binding protein [Acetobacteraceae bacterium]|nr:ABC transporter ATP-binding protein [Acetobacteraceae bacterium]MBV8578977.1 ABC transporter ATP-binding protein [Acetobacteraceae bacterium]
MKTARGLVGLSHSPVAFMFRYVRRHPIGHATILLAILAAVGCAIGSQYAVKHLVDVLSAGSSGPVWTAFFVLAGLICADNLMWRLASWTSTHTFVDVTGDVRRDLFEHLTGHAPAYFADRSPGTLAGRISATGGAIFTVSNTFFWHVLPPCSAIVLSILALTSVSPMMAAALVVAAVILGFIILRVAAAGRRLHQSYAGAAAAVDGELVDVINNMPVVRAFGATMRERERFAGSVRREMAARGHSLRYLERLRLFHAGTTALLSAGLLAWAILLWQTGRASTGDVVLVTTMGFTILHGTRDLAIALVDSIQHVARLSEALSTLLVPHELTDADNAQSLRHANGAVEFEKVNFSYPGSSAVLHDFSLRVARGERVGLVGRSGSGKSTVLALLQRMRDVNSGRILIDGHDIAHLTQESLPHAISVVPQDVMLFHRSVLENIRYGKPEATDEEVYAAASAAGCDFIAGLPEGFGTIVGDRGVKLSGGQRQRLAIARAFLRDAPILLLDEATSALDSESEQAVQRALDRLMTGRTVIAVAHRLSTLRDFDRIVVMQSGRILQDGPPEVLERSPGPYRELLRRQAFRIVDADQPEAAAA